MTIIYLDVSGDLGWKFDANCRRGGSSRYLTIAAAVIKEHKKENKLVKINDSDAQIKFFTMTVRKQEVNARFKAPNGLYNYMIKLLLLSEMGKHEEIHFIPDARTVSVEFKNSLNDYLRTELAALDTGTTLMTTPWESKNSLGLQFVDALANIVWSRHEYGQSKHYDVISPAVQTHHLYFS